MPVLSYRASSLAGLYAGYVFLLSIFFPKAVPALPKEARSPDRLPTGRTLFGGAGAALFLIFLVLGTIFLGIATPTEGGAMGAAGAILLALAKRRLNWALMKQASIPPRSCRPSCCSS